MIFYKVLLAIGTDKPGIVNNVSAFLTDRGCNIDDSKMSVMGEDFALVILFSGPVASIDKVKADIKSLEGTAGLTTLLKDTKAPSSRKSAAAAMYSLECTGMDHPGIINEITSVLHKEKINIENMETGVSNAPVSGSQVFHMSLKMSVPATVSIPKLKEVFSKVESKENLTITLSPAK